MGRARVAKIPAHVYLGQNGGTAPARSGAPAPRDPRYPRDGERTRSTFAARRPGVRCGRSRRNGSTASAHAVDNQNVKEEMSTLRAAATSPDRTVTVVAGPGGSNRERQVQTRGTATFATGAVPRGHDDAPAGGRAVRPRVRGARAAVPRRPGRHRRAGEQDAGGRLRAGTRAAAASADAAGSSAAPDAPASSRQTTTAWTVAASGRRRRGLRLNPALILLEGSAALMKTAYDLVMDLIASLIEWLIITWLAAQAAAVPTLGASEVAAAAATTAEVAVATTRAPRSSSARTR